MNFFDFMLKFPTELAIIEYFIKIRYRNGVKCHHCGNTHLTHRKDFAKMFQCNGCGNSFSIFTGTIFYKSCTDLRKWFYAIHLFLNSKKGISSLQLKREINVTVKCAWRMLKLLREAMGSDDDDSNFMLQDIVEMDECYIGGKAINKHMHKRIALKEKDDKAVVFGMLQRGGKVKAFHVDNVKYHTLGKIAIDNIDNKATIMTDEFRAYTMLRNYFANHKTINHSEGKYVNGDIYTNGIEGFWATMKRGILGIYHHISKKHLQLYINEFCFRYNNRNNASAFDVLLSKTILTKCKFELFI